MSNKAMLKLLDGMSVLCLLAGTAVYLIGGRPMLFGGMLGWGVGALLLLLALALRKNNKRMLYRIWGLVFVGLLSFAALEGYIVANAKTDISGTPKTMVVLGAKLWNGQPSPVLKNRLDGAVTYYNAHCDEQLLIVVTGGMGDDEPISEASSMAQYLQKRGIPAEAILQENQARNTKENLVLTKELLTARGMETDNLLIVSNGAHLARVKLLAKRCGLEVSTLSEPIAGGIGYQAYFYCRESVALVKSFLFDRG